MFGPITFSPRMRLVAAVLLVLLAIALSVLVLHVGPAAAHVIHPSRLADGPGTCTMSHWFPPCLP
jgi:hypothetical protein